jgi:hypothetical protein
MLISIGEVVPKVDDQSEVINEISPVMFQMWLDLVEGATEKCGVFTSRIYRC